jgi:hypothetical protein
MIIVDCNPLHGSRYPYMMASDQCAEELIRFGSSLGLKKEWIRNELGLTYFRINALKRQEAIAKGARQASMREICAIAQGEKAA